MMVTLGKDEIVTRVKNKIVIAHEAPGLQNSIPKSERFGLSYETQLGRTQHLEKLADLFDFSVVCCSREKIEQAMIFRKEVLDRPPSPSHYKTEIPETVRIERFENELNHRLCAWSSVRVVDTEREHFLWKLSRGRQQSCSQARGGDYRLPYHGFLPQFLNLFR